MMIYKNRPYANKKKLRGFGPLANYAERASDRRFLAK
jgi:hypothetical protein